MLLFAASFLLLFAFTKTRSSPSLAYIKMPFDGAGELYAHTNTCAYRINLFNELLQQQNDNLCVDQSINYVSLLYITHLDSHHHHRHHHQHCVLFHFSIHLSISTVGVSFPFAGLWIYGRETQLQPLNGILCLASRWQLHLQVPTRYSRLFQFTYGSRRRANKLHGFPIKDFHLTIGK